MMDIPLFAFIHKGVYKSVQKCTKVTLNYWLDSDMIILKYYTRRPPGRDALVVFLCLQESETPAVMLWRHGVWLSNTYYSLGRTDCPPMVSETIKRKKVSKNE